MDFSTDDWAVFTHPGHGGPIMPSGTGVSTDSDKEHRRARKTFFREAWRQKINPALKKLDDVGDQIEYLLFVRFDAEARQIQTESPEADAFFEGIDERLRHLYRKRFESVQSRIGECPTEEKKSHLRELLLTERQRSHSEESPAFARFSSLVEDEIEKVGLRSIREKDQLPDLFENCPKLLNHAEMIVHRYKDDPAALPEKMTRFKGWLGPGGENMVKQLQRAIREAGLSNRYTHGNPESFCGLVEQLLNQHYDAD